MSLPGGVEIVAGGSRRGGQLVRGARETIATTDRRGRLRHAAVEGSIVVAAAY